MSEGRAEAIYGKASDSKRADGIVATPTWRLYGITGSVPGVLVLSGGRLTLAVEDGRGFDASLSEVRDVIFPWYYFGAGMKVTVSGECYRLSFAEPNGQRDPDLRSDGALGGVGAKALRAAKDARWTVGFLGTGWGRIWRAALAEAGL